MKKNFLKFLLLGVFTLSLGAGFVGCKDYDDDINELRDLIAQIQKQIGGNAVTDIATGSTAGTILVTFADGSSKSVTVNNNTNPGTTGTLTIGADGYWYDNGVITAYKVYESPRLSSDGYWEFPSIVNGTVTWTKSDIYASGAYVVETATSYELYVAEKGSTTLKKISIEKGSAGLGKIDILGWITGKGEASDNISLNVDVKNTDFIVNWARISNFYIDDNPRGTTNNFGSAEANSYVWNGMTTVTRNQVLNTLGEFAESKGFLVQVSPSNVDLSSMEFTLETSKGVAAPISLGTPQLITGMLTKAASTSALYFIPTSYTSATYSGDSNYTNIYTVNNPNAVYTLVEKSTGTRSEYTPWTLTQNGPVTSTEASVNTVNGNTRYAANGQFAGLSWTSFSVFNVPLNVDCSLGFLPSATAGVADYYVEPLEEAIADQYYGFSVDKENGTFKVTKMPDSQTIAYFGLKVYKLGVDGKIYYEVIAIRAVADPWTSDVVYDLGDVVIKDATNAASTPVATGYMTKQTIDLTDMFDALGTTLAAKWKTTSGATNVGWTMVQDDDSAVPQTNRIDATTGVNRQSVITLIDKDGAAITSLANSYKATKISFDINYSSAATAPLTPATVTGSTVRISKDKSYTITGNFYDGNGSLINTIKIKFKAVIPALTDMLTKDQAWWNGDVLNAYFKQLDGNTYRGTTLTDSRFDMTSGFTKVGSSAAADNTKVQFTLNTTQKIPVASSTDFITNWSQLNNTAGALVGNNLSVGSQLYIWAVSNTETANTTAKPAYAQELGVNVAAKYLYDLYDFTSSEKTAAAFKVKPMSATEQGAIVTSESGATTLDLLISGTDVAVIKESLLWGITYAGANAKYGIFANGYQTTPIASYKWQSGYVWKVEFDKVAGSTAFEFVDELNQVKTAPVEAMQYTDNSGTTPVTYFGVGIRTANLTNGSTGKMKVTVTDVYGYAKSTEVTINFVTQ